VTEPIVVLAGSLAQFRMWCRSAGLDPESRHVTYARDVSDLRGRQGARVVRCGTWHLRRDRRELEEAVAWLEGQMASATPDPVASEPRPESPSSR
jgi:hypothetical protein